MLKEEESVPCETDLSEKGKQKEMGTFIEKGDIEDEFYSGMAGKLKAKKTDTKKSAKVPHLPICFLLPFSSFR